MAKITILTQEVISLKQRAGKKSRTHIFVYSMLVHLTNLIERSSAQTPQTIA